MVWTANPLREEDRMIREAKESDCVNLAALSLEVWLTTYSIDGIRTENSRYALSTFTEKHFKELLNDPQYKILPESVTSALHPISR
jgi:diamine N-acetyltransferase